MTPPFSPCCWWILALLITAGSRCSAPVVADPLPLTAAERDRMPTYRGISFVAPPRPFSADPMPPLQAVGTNWIAVIPYAFTRAGQPSVRYNMQGYQWWGERPEGVRRSIELAHAAGIGVLLKPQVYIPGSWTGELDFDSDDAWAAWEQDYEAYLLPLVEMAQELGVGAVCVGTEFKIAAVKREAFWRSLITKVRERFDGTITYAANWDAYASVPFWDAVDLVGINAYFPLDPATTPPVAQLVEAWQPWKRDILAFQRRIQRPVAFTEFGYLSVDGAAHETWTLEKKVESLPINEQAQANAIEALFATFWAEPWWQGGFLWKWFPQMQGHEGYPARDYTPQGKRAEQTLSAWYTPPTTSTPE